MSADKRDIVHEYQILNAEDNQRIMAQEEDAHVRHVVSEVRRNYRRKFPKSPSLRRGDKIDACRIYGSLEGNKVQGDFHITARGHGYQDLGGHLDHKSKLLFKSLLWCGAHEDRLLLHVCCCALSDLTNLKNNSVQLLTHDHGAVLWPSLPDSSKSPRQNNVFHRSALFQIPILPQPRSYYLHKGQRRSQHLYTSSNLTSSVFVTNEQHFNDGTPRSFAHQKEKHDLYQPILGNKSITLPSGKPVLRAWDLLQVQH